MDRICHLFEARRRFLHAAAAVLALGAWPLATDAKDKLLGETVELSGAVLFAETKVPALVVGVVRNAETSGFGFGKIGPADDRAPDGKSLLRIGSITKAFTGAVLAKLCFPMRRRCP
jgi:D-alanyl-D-alanine-carboxypeptidase/D-alanyl-D-alanine-endopeptidase